MNRRNDQPRIALPWLLMAAMMTRNVNAELPAEFDDLRLQVVVADHHQRTDRAPALLVHFHGASQTVQQNFRQAGLSGVLACVNCDGLSSAYRRPFENRRLFSVLLEEIRRRLVAKDLLDSSARWGRVDVSCFSAGYGAVREVLKQANHVSRIDAVVAADSIYASIERDGGRRIVDAVQMHPFLEFAVRAKRGEKSFLIFHSQLPVNEYASTGETARYLVQQTNIPPRPLRSRSEPFAARTVAAAGGLFVVGFAGDDGEAHLEHLRQIALAWRCLHAHRQLHDAAQREQATLAILNGDTPASDRSP